MEIPLSETDANTNPIIPIGANWMMPPTILFTAFAKSFKITLVVSLATILRAIPKTTDQKSIPRYCPFDINSTGFENTPRIILDIISVRLPGAA